MSRRQPQIQSDTQYLPNRDPAGTIWTTFPAHPCSGVFKYDTVVPTAPPAFLTATALGAAAAQLSAVTPAFAQPARALQRLEPLKSIDAGTLNIGYYEAGPANGAPVILLHGWPYDIHMFVDVAPALAAAGLRVIVPHLRGYGTTRFLSADTPRNGQQSVVAVDIIALMDALDIRTATVAGCDWGARTACIMAALWPERVNALVSVSGYLIGSRAAGKVPLPPPAELQWWYQYYFATERGRAGYEKNRHDFAKLIWQLASPKWNFDDGDLRPQRSWRSRTPTTCAIVDPQLPLAPRSGRRRGEVPAARGPAGQGARDRRADHHPRRRCQRRAASGAQHLREEVLGALRTSAGERWHRPQPAAGSPEAFARAVLDLARG